MRVNESNLICTEAATYQVARPSARTPWRFAVLLCLLAWLCPFALHAQNFVYVNNQSGVSNSIASFSVDAGGALTSLGTVSTGGTGATVACAGIDRITVNRASNLLFVSNGGNQTISVFRIAPATGGLAAIVGSPFASGLTLDSCQGISLAATPDGKFLMASSNGAIKTFSIAANGSLSLSSTASLLPSPMVGMKVSGDGRFLAVSHQASVSVFTISGINGSLTAVAGSPFIKTGTGLVGGLDFNCDGTLLYAAEGGSTSSITDAWSVGASGALTPILGSPFTAAGSDSNVVFLTPDNTILYQSNQGSKDLNTFTVNPDGTLTSIGLASIAAGHTPAGLAGDNSGLFLYGADDAFGLAVFNIAPGVVPTLVGDTAIAGAGQIQGVAAYPPRSCAHTDFSVTQTASPNPVTAGSQLTYNITITNNGPSTASVAINDLLPRNFVSFISCTPGPGGVCDKGAGLNRTITFASLASGQSGTATIVASTISTLLNGDTISNTSNISNSSAVDTNPANNSATTAVTVSAPLSATNFIVANSTGNYFGTASLSTTLKRTLNGAAVAGRNITFTLDGTIVGTAVTSATGVASLPNVSLVLGGIPLTAGAHSIGVSFAGDSQYQASTGTSTLTINKAVLTVTAQNASKIYGDANPAFTYVITGFLNNETVAVVSGTASCSSSANAGSDVGTAPITCATGTLVATNYSFAFVPATLTINRAPLVLAANNISRFYGDANPALTGTVVGLKNADKATATFSTAALAASPVGVYPITGTVVPGPSFLATNYSITSSGTLTVNPAPLTATAANATRLYGDPNPTFTGTITGARNGDVFTATFASAATPASPVGTYPIVAALSGAPSVISNYTVTSNSGTLTVAPAALSVTAANASRLYGDANPAFTGTITGLKNADNITASYASAATGASPVGTSAIVPTLLDPTSKLSNYTVTSTNGTLTITPAPLSVVAANASRLYGDPNPVFTGTLTGIKNSDNITASYASAADPTSPVGTYAIVPTLADPTTKLGNYTVTSSNGNLTVAPAPLTVSAANASRLYGDPNPAFTGTLTGIKNADNITATFSSAATPASAVGTFAIVPALADPTAKLGNYTVTSNNGTLAVAPAPLSVTGTSASRLYGDPNPAFTGTLTGIKNGDNITATFASAATLASAVGTYPIIPTLADPTAKLGNYAVTSANGTLTVNPSALTVTGTNATRAYGDPNPLFAGTVTGLKNGDNITATFASAANLGSPVGTYPIVATLADPTAKLGNYSVTSNNGTLTVSPAALTVTGTNATRAYGDPNPLFAGTITGLKNGDNITATFVSAATPASPVGTFAIVPTLVDPTAKLGNYTVSSNNGTLTVSPAALTVTATNATRAYGDPNPLFAGAITGLKNGDNITATFASAANAASPVGTFAIIPTLADPTAKLGNYAVTSNNGTLTVSSAALTVTVTNATRAYGDPNPLFAGTLTGLKNGDNITATFASTANAASPVGTFAIVPTLVDPTAKLGNYAVTSNNGTLTVSPASLIVTGTNASRLYGAANPAFTGTITGIKNADNITATFASAATAASAVGGYPIVATLVDPTAKLGNYSVTSNNGTLTVDPAALTVTAANATRVYGDPNAAFTGSIGGLKNGDIITATFASTATAASAVGAYAITPSLADPNTKLGNYTVTSNNGTLTITAASLTVNTGNASRAYGDGNPAFAGTIIGLKNSDAITANYASIANATSPVGTYPVSPTLVDPTSKLGNYNVTLNNGTLTVTPALLSVTATNASRLYGDPNPVFAGTISGLKNGDAITATFATLATPGSPVGTYAIVPTLQDPTAKLGNYTASSINGVLTVTPSPLNVSAGSTSRVYGDPNSVFTGSITGLKNGDVITATFASAATSASAVGTYPILPTLSDPTTRLGNYSVVSNNGTLTVSPAALTVTANNATRTYGDANPAFTGTLSGLKNGDNITASFTSADPTSPVGTYPIIPALADPTTKLGNYTVNATNGVLTVTPASLSVSVNNATRLYGDANPLFTGTIAGLKNSDNITASFTSVDATSPIGAFPIVAALADPTGKLGNYSVTSANGTLTIAPAALKVAATNAARVYGDANPAFTGTLNGIKNGDNITATFASAATPASGVGTFSIVPTLIDPATKLGNYTVASTNGTLTVGPAPLTVTGGNGARAYGDPNPIFTGAITGIRNNDNITASFASAANPGSPVGTYSIVPTLVDPAARLGNYTVSSINGVLTVSPVPLNVSTASASRVYGDPNPAFTGTITGLKNGDVITATFASVAAAASPVGTYPIVATFVDPTVKLGNYTINSNNGILTVTPAALTVTAGNASRVYGDPNPAFTGTITGIKNGDNITATVTGADPSSPVGTYTLVPSLVDPAGKLGNYAVTSNNGILTVGPAGLTVIATNAARAYGQPNPAFTGTIAGLKNADNITATFSSAADVNSTLGTYPIVPALNDPSLKLPNYTVTLKNGTLIIGPVKPAVVLTVQPGQSTALLTAQVLNSGTIFPTGTVQFSEGTTALGQPVTLAQVPPGTTATASLQVPLTGGTHTISATYSGDLTYTASSASPVTVVVAGPPPGLRFVPVTPCRIADTRNPVGPFGGPFLNGGTSRGFAVPNSACNIPATAQAYSVNVTVVPKGPLGFLTMFPCGQTLPLASTLNSTDGRVKAAAAIVPAGTSGGICAFATNDTELILDINGYFVTDSSPAVLAFYPVAPCRLVDTRNTAGALGGPSLVGNVTRTFPILASPCQIPATAKAYSLNFTSVPKGSLGFLTTWPAGQTIPLVSTLNATTGAVTANAAIVPSGTNGDISVFVTNDSDVVIDINGYFAPPGTGGLSFFPLAPCRVVDTRNPAGAQPFTGKLDVNVTASGCGAPTSAQSFVLNATVVPPGSLGFLTLWPQGAAQPLVSTLNAIDGAVTSNMAIVPTTNGSISAFVSNPDHLVLDISGYFAP